MGPSTVTVRFPQSVSGERNWPPLGNRVCDRHGASLPPRRLEAPGVRTSTVRSRRWSSACSRAVPPRPKRRETRWRSPFHASVPAAWTTAAPPAAANSSSMPHPIPTGPRAISRPPRSHHSSPSPVPLKEADRATSREFPLSPADFGLGTAGSRTRSPWEDPRQRVLDLVVLVALLALCAGMRRPSRPPGPPPVRPGPPAGPGRRSR